MSEGAAPSAALRAVFPQCGEEKALPRPGLYGSAPLQNATNTLAALSRCASPDSIVPTFGHPATCVTETLVGRPSLEPEP